jgi:hypothetical protein
LWLDGEIPADLRSVWEEAKLVLPEWPGFRRLTVTDAEREAIASFRKMLDDFEDEMFAEADAASKIIDEAGISHVQMMFHTDKPKDK